MYYCKWQKTDVFTPTWSAPLSAAPRKQGSSLGAAAEPCIVQPSEKEPGSASPSSYTHCPQRLLSVCDFGRIKKFNLLLHIWARLKYRIIRGLDLSVLFALNISCFNIKSSWSLVDYINQKNQVGVCSASIQDSKIFSRYWKDWSVS